MKSIHQPAVWCALNAALASLLAAALPADYQLAPLPDPLDKPLRTRAELATSVERVYSDYLDKEFAARGFLDVTKAPYHAKGDGVADDTAALQRALRDARDARLALWLPAGTYLVRDTLQGVQGVVEYRGRAKGETGEIRRPNEYPCVIQGAGGPRRPLIKLAPDAPGFDDPARPKPVLFVWARNWQPPYDCQPNVSFNQVLLGVDFDIRGHAGAIAVDWQGAQGTAVQDVRIEAAGAFAGLRGLTGSGGSTHGLVVRGGRYGVLAAGLGAGHKSGAQPAPLLAEVTLEGQEEAAIHYAGRGPLTLVGAIIRGRGIVAGGMRDAYDGALTLVDCLLDLGGGTAATADRPVFLKNSYVRGTDSLVRIKGRLLLPAANNAGWTHVREFAGAPEGPYPIWIAGRKQSAAHADAGAGTPPADLQSRHALPRLPAWNDAGVTQAKPHPYLESGDETEDDAPAIQRALDEKGVVFLPKGTYRLGRPLVLEPGQTLYGAGRVYTVLAPLEGAVAFSNRASPQPLIETVNDAAADIVLARLGLHPDAPGAYALRWRAGGAGAAVLDVDLRISASRGYADGPSVRIEGGGGGRWFNFGNHGTVSGSGPGYRHLLVQGTRRPLSFYMYNIEHARSDMMTEFVDVRDVTIYALKGETFQIGNAATGTRPLIVARDAERFSIYGAGGICGAAPGWPPYVYRFENSRDILVANAGHQYALRSQIFGDPQTWSFIQDRREHSEISTPGNEYFVLYRR